MKRRNNKILIILAVLLVVGYLGYQTIYKSKDIMMDDVKTQEYELKLMDINQTYSTTGNVSSKVDKIITAPFTSEKFTLAVDIGDELEKGDVIGIFDDSDIRINLLIQEKSVISIEYQLDQLKSEGNKSYFSSFESSRISYENAKEIYEKNIELYNSGAISFSELESSKDAMNNSQYTYDLNSSRYYGFNLQNEIEILEKTLEVEKIRLEKLNDDFEEVELTAENSGTIVDIFVESGDSVNVGQNLYRIMNLDELEIITQISEYEIKDIKESQKVIVTILGDDSVITMGEIIKVYPSAFVSGNDATVNIIIDLINPDSALMPGFSTNVEIMIANKENAKVVPYDALISSPKGYTVIKVVDGEEQIIPVATGIESDLMIEIISDEINEGDIVKVMSTIDFSNDTKDGEMMFPGKNRLDNEKP